MGRGCRNLLAAASPAPELPALWDQAGRFGSWLLNAKQRFVEAGHEDASAMIVAVLEFVLPSPATHAVLSLLEAGGIVC